MPPGSAASSGVPANYVSAWFAFFGQGFFWQANILNPESSEPGSVPFWDPLVTILFCIAWTAVVLAWLAVVVPAQYCVSLVCGAPVRLTLATPRDVIVERLERKKPRSGRTWIPTSPKRVNVGLNGSWSSASGESVRAADPLAAEWEATPRGPNDALTAHSLVECITFAVGQPRDCFIKAFHFEQA